jgi:hypothetical protein
MEHTQVHRRTLTGATPLRSEHPSRTVEKLRLLVGDLVRMNVELLNQLGQRLLALFAAKQL